MAQSWTGELTVTVLVWATVLVGLWIAEPTPAQLVAPIEATEILPEAIEGNERYIERGLLGDSDQPATPLPSLTVPAPEVTSGPAVGA